ncbi:MAG TPA: hypothetical protein VFJ85_12120 [Acidimicrobiales bacterium]|nr:hypothetical protein [Acidimicrobiales bacterium]
MTPAAGPYLAACLLLVAAGAAKVARPEPARRALRRVGAALPAGAVRAGGMAEAALGAAGALTGSAVAAAAVAACYLGFAAFMVRNPVGGCGCFGSEAGDAAGPLHALVDAGLAAAATMVAAAGGLHPAPPGRAALVAGGAGLAWVTYLVLVPGARLAAAGRALRR